jgi:hypothetical protein
MARRLPGVNHSIVTLGANVQIESTACGRDDSHG